MHSRHAVFFIRLSAIVRGAVVDSAATCQQHSRRVFNMTVRDAARQGLRASRHSSTVRKIQMTFANVFYLTLQLNESIASLTALLRLLDENMWKD